MTQAMQYKFRPRSLSPVIDTRQKLIVGVNDTGNETLWQRQHLVFNLKNPSEKQAIRVQPNSVLKNFLAQKLKVNFAIVATGEQ